MKLLNDPALTVLHNLLHRGSIENERVRDIIISVKKIQDYPFENSQSMSTFHSTLILAEKNKAVLLEWRKHYELEQLDKIRLVDARKLAIFLGVTFRPNDINAIFESIEHSTLPGWLIKALNIIESNWLKGKKAFGLDLGDANKLPDLLTAATAIGEGLPEASPLDYRQFGARYLTHSKRTKELEKCISSLYKWHLNLDTWKPHEVMAQLNLVPISQPILMRGPLTFTSNGTVLSCDFFPYVGLPVDCIDSLKLLRQPTYFITIENQSSFNEYTRDINDDAIVLYTAGFPTKAIQHLLFIITTHLNSNVSCYHWGDTDPHGFMILKILQKHSRLSIQPHLMNSIDGDVYSASQLKTLESLMPINKFVDKEIQYKLTSKKGLLEQEIIKAKPPFHNTHN